MLLVAYALQKITIFLLDYVKKLSKNKKFKNYKICILNFKRCKRHTNLN